MPAQLIAPDQPVPRTAKLPVVFVNGYQTDCSNSSFASTFGVADQVLRDNGQVSVFFDNCSVPGKPSLEKLGAAFGAFLANLKYTDGTQPESVDVVAHSMGGLIVRSYLSGKQEQDGSFAPPAVTRIRKAVFFATPHFGTPIAAVAFGIDSQVTALNSGSHFLYDLASWNDGSDDLRGVDALALAGSGGTGRAIAPGFDDGLVALTSASLGFSRPGRTRVVPFCHVDGGGLISLAGFCDFSARGIARIRSAGEDPARILISFLNGTTDWQTIGEAAEQNRLLTTLAGVLVRPFDATGAAIKLTSSTVAASDGSSKKLNMSNDEIAYTDGVAAGKTTITSVKSSGTLSRVITAPAGAQQTYPLKAGPNISRVYPAAASIFPLTFAPRTIISLYGDTLASLNDEARSIPLPPTLAGATVSLNGVALGLLSVSPAQINAVLPDSASGLQTLTVQTAAGTSTVRLLIEKAHPTIFTADRTGTGLAAAINVRNGLIVAGDNPLRANDYLTLFLTGLGTTTRQNGFDVANQQPVVTVAGANCAVSYAGAAPGYVGLDQVNCQVPAGIPSNPAAPVVVTSGGVASNIATIPIQ